MKILTQLTLVLLALNAPTLALAENSKPTPLFNDTEIRILLVGDLTLVDPNLINMQVAFLEEAWASSHWISGFGDPSISIKIANSGIPIEYSDNDDGKICCGRDESLDEIDAFVSMPSVSIGGGDPVSLRDAHGADLVIGFTDGFNDPGVCGLVNQGPWVNDENHPIWPSPQLILNPVTFFLDLRGSEEAYVAVVSLDDGFIENCALEEHTTAHEFGHLLGGGHWDAPGPGDIHYLYSDSRSGRWAMANQFRFWPPPTYTVWQSAIGTGSGGGCIVENHETTDCFNLAYFSDEEDFFYTPGHRNTRALEDTAESVANFRRGEPLISLDTCTDGLDNDGDGDADGADQECDGTSVTEVPPAPPPPPVCDHTVPPYNVEGYLLQQCVQVNGALWTSHRIRWAHHCPQTVDRYEIIFSQPDGSGYEFGWTSLSTSTDSLVRQYPSRVKIRSCWGGSCSAPSASSFLAIPEC